MKAIQGKCTSENKAGPIMLNLVLLGFALLFSSSLFAYTIPKYGALSGGLDYKIAKWQGFKKSAFTISFDDNYRFQVTKATPLLNQHNYKATYFIVTNRVGAGWAPGWDTLNMLASQGHEIGSHSKNHSDFVILTRDTIYTDSMNREFRDSRDTINARIPSQRCETFAWPFGSVNVPAINVSKNYYMACRGSVNDFEGADPENFYNIFSQHIYSDTPLETVNGYIDTILLREGWLVERWHGFRVNHDTNGYEPVPIGEFEDHLNHVAQNEDDLWISPLGPVIKYMRERDSSKFYFVDSTGYKVRFSLVNNLPDTLFHYNTPLSLRLKIYGKMAKVYMITQGSNILSFNIAFENGASYLYFDAVPNDSLIVLHLPDPLNIANNVMLKDGILNYPNPFTGTTRVVFDIPESGYAEISISDQAGRALKVWGHTYPAGRNSFDFNGSGLLPGVYQCIIRTSARTMNVRMLLIR